MIWPILYFWKFANGVAKNGKSVSLFVALLLWVNNIIDTVIYGGLNAIGSLMQSLNISAFQNLSLASLPQIQYINGIFPVSEFVSMSLVYVTAVCLLITIRWVKSVIPTLAN